MSEMGEATEKKGGGMMRIIGLVGGLILVVLVAGGAAYWAATTAISSTPGGKPATPKDKAGVVDGVPYDAGEFVTNLADPGGRRLIRIKLEVGLSDEQAKAELEKRNGAMRDAVIGVLRSKTVADLNQDKDMAVLRGEIQKKIEPLVTEGKVVYLFITEFAVQ